MVVQYTCGYFDGGKWCDGSYVESPDTVNFVAGATFDSSGKLIQSDMWDVDLKPIKLVTHEDITDELDKAINWHLELFHGEESTKCKYCTDGIDWYGIAAAFVIACIASSVVCALMCRYVM